MPRFVVVHDLSESRVVDVETCTEAAFNRQGPQLDRLVIELESDPQLFLAYRRRRITRPVVLSEVAR